MPLSDTLQTYAYYIAELCAMSIAYIQLDLYTPLVDIPIVKNAEPDRVLLRATPHDILATYGAIVKPSTAVLKNHAELTIRGRAMPTPENKSKNPTPTRLLACGELTPEIAEKLLAEGIIDAAVFARLWLTNPDLQKRVERGVPLNTGENINLATLYSIADGDPRIGYSDYPVAA